MELMIDTKEIILALKKVYEEKNLSIDKALALVDEKEGKGAVSRSTIQRIFAKGSEDDPASFRYETTLKPICNALLDIDTIETEDDSDKRAYKTLLKLKRDIIDELQKSNEQVKIDYAEKLQEETEKFQKSLEFIKHQVELKDQRIDALMSLTTELMTTNNKLVTQLMECPLRKER
jgi:hypothetical protein